MNSEFSTIALLPPDLARPVTDIAKGGKAAREFEGQLIASLLASLEKTFATVPGEKALAGEDNYDYIGTEALGSVLAAGGGFGLASLIARDLGKHEGKT